MAEPGGICLSEAVRAALGDAVPAALRDRGEQSLKNIARRVHVFELPPPPGCSPAASSARAAVHGDHGSERPSLAVLPFKTIGGDGSQDYFAEGLGEELTTALSKFGWLRIIAANSSRAVHQYTPDARAAAAALEVRFVLQGSVRLGGNRVRVAAHLVDAASGTQVWSERYDRAIADIFEIQDDITQHIVSELSSEITVAEIERVHRQRPVNLSAWDAYLRALPLLRDHTEASNARAAELLRNAIERAPGLACAWARLSACEVQAAYYNWSGSTQARVQRAIDLARRAYALDPREPLALDALASAYQFVGDAENAARTAAQALEISPTCAAAYGTLVTSLAFLGRIEEAKRVVERSRRSNPRDPDSAALTFGLVVISFLEGDYERAAQTARAYIAMRPNWYGGHQYLTAACALGGHLAEAQQAAGALLRSRPGFSLAQYRSEARLRRPEDLGRVVEGLRLAGIPEGDAS